MDMTPEGKEKALTQFKALLCCWNIYSMHINVYSDNFFKPRKQADCLY